VQPGQFRVRQGLADVGLLEPPLLVGQLVDAGDQVLVGHGCSFDRGTTRGYGEPTSGRPDGYRRPAPPPVPGP
jgi:hypothetical protein